MKKSKNLKEIVIKVEGEKWESALDMAFKKANEKAKIPVPLRCDADDDILRRNVRDDSAVHRRAGVGLHHRCAALAPSGRYAGGRLAHLLRHPGPRHGRGELQVDPLGSRDPGGAHDRQAPLCTPEGAGDGLRGGTAHGHGLGRHTPRQHKVRLLHHSCDGVQRSVVNADAVYVRSICCIDIYSDPVR